MPGANQITTARAVGVAVCAVQVVWTFGRDIVELGRRYAGQPAPSPQVASRVH
ncbi:MAG: hypothetical protein LWW86_04775 [Micrococcales bacterium]|nr:hypothetical protein [Micrococcales bacterium]